MGNNLTLPFPLSDGKMVYLYAPPEMPIKDARRLKRMVSALYINGRQK